MNRFKVRNKVRCFGIGFFLLLPSLGYQEGGWKGHVNVEEEKDEGGRGGGLFL